MSTKAQITTAINAKIRNKTPLVIKTEHADVEQLITDQLFPINAFVGWDGSDPVDPITDIICSGSLTSSDNISFFVNFWKQGNEVYFNGEVKSLSGNFALDALLLIEFPTTLYKPTTDSMVKVNMISSYNQTSKQTVIVKDTGIYLTAGLPSQVSSILATWNFNGTYKVIN